MEREIIGKTKNSKVKSLPWLRRMTVLLVFLLLSEVFIFAVTYRHLIQSIQNERVDSIEQMSTLISEKLLLLRQIYEDKVRQAALVITSNHVQSLDQGQELLLAFEQLYLLAEDGSCISLAGERIVLSESKEIKMLKSSDKIRIDFCTVQAKGDFWVFMSPVSDVTIDGKEFFGVIMLVDANSYAEAAATEAEIALIPHCTYYNGNFAKFYEGDAAMLYRFYLRGLDDEDYLTTYEIRGADLKALLEHPMINGGEIANDKRYTIAAWATSIDETYIVSTLTVHSELGNNTDLVTAAVRQVRFLR